MKKLIAVLLICVMMFALAVPALADTCYMLILSVLTNPDSGVDYLGTQMTIPSENMKGAVFVVYNSESGSFSLTGPDQSNNIIANIWLDVAPDSAISNLLDICEIWDMMASFCDPGNKLVLCWDYGGENSMFIDTPEKAAEFCDLFGK